MSNKKASRTLRSSFSTSLAALTLTMGRIIILGNPRWTILALAVFLAPQVGTAVFAAPAPSSTSTLGMTVTNPVTGLDTTVTVLRSDLVGVAFVDTADGYSILVRAVGQKVYNNDPTPVGFTVVSNTTTNGGSMVLDADPVGGTTASLSYPLLTTTLSTQFLGSSTPGTPGTAPTVVGGANGVRIVGIGDAGSNGRAGALFVPPSSGGDGAPGPAVNYTNNTTISTTNQIGIEAGSIGGDGGDGGNSYLSFWDGRDGGDGGAGGSVNVINNTGIQVATTGTDKHGIFAYSRSGAAGDGGSGFLAPGGGTGGHSSDGGSVTVTNRGSIITTGDGAHGIYGLSVSNNGGNGGSQWGLVGESGDGGFGGSGGSIDITNTSTGSIYTSGNYAHGILAQSIGGSGGSSGTSGNLILSLQGTPDNGGNGGQVTVTNNGSITTTGNYSRGIMAQSTGGGGGSGGGSFGLVALGGSGSNGGSGSTVTVKNDSLGAIATSGIGSDGIFAQSVGGSGGSGSDAGGLVAVGGGGSKAGNGAAVTVENFGSIATTQNSARGIVAQSIGGGGGDGGNTGGLVAVGGSGAGGGTGATVTIKQGGSITTKGNDAMGILAQSVGGGGGNGGSSGSVGVFVGVAIGGTGGGGGVGGNVDLMLQGKDANTASLIKTEGDRSMGLFAQSVGGGGGNGGGAVQISAGFGAAASFAVGGSGGAGGAGGVVSMSKGTGVSIVQTGGNDSTGIMLQSVGGGGGNGGLAVAVALSAGPASGSLSAAVGGSGGTGGAGGTVTVGSFDGAGSLVNTGFNGSITTAGDRSTGFFAQSVGGGGGNGGLAVSAAAAASLTVSGSIAIGVGGTGGVAGNGGTVSVGTQGNITTQQANSTGFLAQSVGGGGGNGGASIAASAAGSAIAAGSINFGMGGAGGAGGFGGEVNAATRSGTISTNGENSTGIIVQSVGGGGGNGGYVIAAGGAGAGVGAGALSIGLGGSGGAGSQGGIVRADLQSNVTTARNNSGGILVQSVGGGGGNGGFSIAASGAGAGVGSGAISVGLGGKAGSGGVGGTVIASSTGVITTGGNNSTGFNAQSVGGGGGNGGFNVSVSGAGAGVGSGAIDVGLGGSGGAGGNGGTVTANAATGKVTTTGNDSLGILAQSVGGGGGNGGFNVGVSGSGAGVGSGAISVGLGGKGGSAGAGNTVNLTVNNDVSTGGDNSHAIAAQSIGGGGGNGGFNVSLAGSGAGVGSGAIAVGLGGAGSGGGSGGEVTANIEGDVDTLGDNAYGVIAQSLGGGGGNGGFNVSAAGSGGGVGSGGIAVGLGGNGGTAGIGKKVDATYTGTIATQGKGSTAFMAQSLGGGGGNGGFNVTAVGSGAGVGSGSIGVGLGGDGAGGGKGGIVIADVTGRITTQGDEAAGIIAQSIGGGGGNGGFNVTATGSGAGVGSGAIAVGLGGKGAGGGSGDAVTLKVKQDGALANSDITTQGKDATAVLAQSVGGGGGNGGFNVTVAGSGAGVGSGGISVGLGGGGGAAGVAGNVDLEIANNVSTAGKNSHGVVAQSLGGGGGNGGFNVTASGSGAGTGSGAIAVGLGGNGAGGGDAGTVTAKATGDISTKGDNSLGLLAQSLGGGGGNGGFNVTATGSGAGTGSGVIGVGLGGSGDGGGNGKKVDATAEGTINTEGDDSTAFTAQSLGGGGGNGAFNVTVAGSGAGTGSGAISVGLGGTGAGGGDGGEVVASTSDDIETKGDRSLGILAQSVGGGGGSGGFNVSVAGSGAGTGSGAVSVGLGGSGAGGGNADIVTLTVNNDVTTSGFGSTGIVAQSVGGGGGNGGFNVSAALSGAGTGSGAVGIGLGGSAGDGGYAKDVTSTITGNITTRAVTPVGAISTDAYPGSGGVLIQSLGGGGGNGGFNVAGSLSFANTGSGAVSVGLGGSGGNGGYAGNVTNSLTGDVYTYSNGGFGVTAQSIGGGGGSGGMNISGAISVAKTGSGAVGVGIGGFGGDGGYAATVDNTVTGYVQTNGKNAGGILAQSLGGGGGNGGLNVTGVITAANTGSGNLGVGIGGFGGKGGNAGAVINNVTGHVDTSGDDSTAIAAQSLGGGGGNGATNVTGTVNLTKENGGTLGVGVGGFGADGGNAGTVDSTVITTGGNKITTSGDRSSAVTAQSIGGGGGNGGVNITEAVNITGKNGAAVGVGVGGFGGGGGNSDKVTLDVTGEILTQGNESHGLLAQSIGGGGGNGGTNVSGTLAFTSGTGTAKTAAVSIGVGGFGGDGGNAGDVDVTYHGTEINSASSVDYATDAGAHGIAAQSIGGGGGNGAVNVSAGLSFTSSSTGDAYGVMFGVGGFGGKGGTAGSVDVTVNNTNSITARGQDRAAILAQSLGGGGGNGGLNVTGGITTDSSLLVGIGGFGANAGTASTVNVQANSDLFAYSSDSDESPSAAAGGIVAQSIGGGGGNGALNVTGGITLKKESTLPSINVGIGGFGGAGAESDTVTVNHTGNITSVGDWTHGVLAQSIAGGGGNGGANVSGQLNFADSKNSGGKTDLTIVAGIGGKGGDAADSAAVMVTQNGVISTSGDHARGIIAQSIGGGGGTGGMNITGVVAQKSSPIQVGIGGSGGNAGNAGSVLVNRGTAAASTGQITTNGEGSHGIEASSLGGGGGDAGINFNVGFTLAGKVPSQSGSAVQITIGGNGGDSSHSSTAEVNNYSDIETQGRNSHGILAQSIGGGGGNANLNHAFTYANPSSGAKENKNLGLSFALGGAVGDGGYSEQVDVVHVGNISTLGNYSFGIMAQSVGGGGGNADSEAESTFLDIVTGFEGVEVGGPSVSIAIGRNGGDGGYSGKVNLASEGQISTNGKGSYGLLAQSIGGGGGNSTSTSVSGSFGDAEASISVGLKGGTGGHSDDVTLNAQGKVTTSGEDAHGVFAQSIGGGGGNGGSDDDFTDVGVGDLKTAYDSVTDEGTGTSVNVSIGGDGGEGGYSGNVNVTSSADISTNADRSVGILAQSVGGGGGSGGLARTDYSSAGSTINLLIGGKGGLGMYSGNVNVNNSGLIATDGDTSHGILAQSLGGGGGNGGMAIKATLLNTSSGTFDLSTSLGGNGGTGGAAGNVTVTNESSGTIYTKKDNSFGIFAQSVGGGGGNAGQAIAGTLVSAAENRFALTIGGKGGIGGTGGAVEVVNDGFIRTEGAKSHGIVAQSVGGGGGTGGLSLIADLALLAAPSGAGLAGNFAIGGSGGSGNTSGDVTVKNTGSIEVLGDGAYGIYAQSVGGGGGDGGFAASFSTSALAPDPATALAKSLLTFAMGGFGGSGADSGDVLVEHSGNITSYGDNSFGIYAQSVGGGGGKSAYSFSSPVWTVADAIFKTIIGGGSAGQAGKTTINTTGDIVMLGENSQASFAQSVNGGGGNTELFLDFSYQDSRIPVNAVIEADTQLGSEGAEDASSDEVVMTHVGNLATKLNNSTGSLLQAVGGGGGNAIQKVVIEDSTKLDLLFTLGAKNTNNSSGGDITQERTGNIATEGDYSAASSVQSVGGGGGHLLVDVETVDGSGNDVSGTNSKATAKITLGADPSFVNNGGDITQTYIGDTTTLGDMSTGLEVQTIGAGGGIAKISGMDSVEVILGAQDNSTGDGGDIAFTNTGLLATDGLLSHGAVIQSIGGGGGFVLTGLDPSKVTVTPSNKNGGNGGDITFNQLGNVMVGGDRSFGIFAQSLGGGGGLVDDFFAGAAGGEGSSGAIGVNLDGNLAATGTNNIGIFAQSRGSGSQGNITVALADDKTIQMNDSGIGVKISGGANNSFTNNGGSVIAATRFNNPDGYTVVGEEGNETVLNKSTGIFYGNMNLGGGVNSFSSELGASVFTGREMFIGGDTQSTFTNRGLISPGDQSVYTTEIAGNYNQTETADFDLNLDFTDDLLDRLNITQDASLEGDLNVFTGGVAKIKPGQRTLIFAATDPNNAASEITKETLNLVIPPSAIATYKIGSTNKIAFLDIDVSFTGFGVLNRNQTAFGDYLNRVQLAGSSEAIAPLIEAIFALKEPLDLRTPFDSLSPEIYGSIHSNLQLTSRQLRDDLFTCKTSGDRRVITEGECIWLDIATLGNNGDRTYERFDFETSASAISAGAQIDLGEQWYLALAAGASVYETASSTQPAKMNGSSNEAGLALKKSFGSTDIGLGIVGGSGEFDGERFNIFPFGDHVTSEQDASFFGSWLRVSHDINAGGGWYVRPLLDFGSTRVKYESFEESGAGALSLLVDESSQAYVTLTPAIEFGGEFKAKNLTIRPTVYLGYTQYLTNSNPATSARLAGAPDVDSFEVSSQGDRNIFDAAANVEFAFLNGLSMKMGYWGRFSGNTTVHGADFKVNLSF